jgi:hypothetical protein
MKRRVGIAVLLPRTRLLRARSVGGLILSALIPHYALRCILAIVKLVVLVEHRFGAERRRIVVLSRAGDLLFWA